MKLSKAFDDVRKERQRQVYGERWTKDHDDGHMDGTLSNAGSCYAIRAFQNKDFTPPVDWPWDSRWWKPKDTRRDLVRAAALIVAEIERLDRRPKPDGGRT